MKIRLLSFIHSIYEKQSTVRGYKDAEGKAVLETQSEGVFAVIGSPPIAIYVGMENPGLRIGPVAITIEQEEAKS
jgi:hypothetical protein